MEPNEKRVDLENCSNCNFYMITEYDFSEYNYIPTYGQCRRFPPTRIDRSNSRFPIVEDDYWCGEFKKNFDKNDN